MAAKEAGVTPAMPRMILLNCPTRSAAELHVDLSRTFVKPAMLNHTPFWVRRLGTNIVSNAVSGFTHERPCKSRSPIMPLVPRPKIARKLVSPNP